jgi:methionine synthase II (cobalamin-independent)
MISWLAGSATGIGSLPGVDVREAMRTVLGELPEFPHLPELPARGPAADLVGRGVGLLVELPAEVTTSGWRFCDRPGRDLRRSRDLLERDLDTMAEEAAGYAGAFKIQVAGPWTLLAAVELKTGEKALADRGAVAEVIQSLAAGVAEHIADVRRRLPGAKLVVQIDEPSLPAVLAARIATSSGLRTLRAVESSVARDGLGLVISAAGVPVVVHCCAADVPLQILRDSGAAGVALDLALLDLSGTPTLDRLAEHLETSELFAGVDPDQPPAVIAATLRGLWRRLGLAPEALPERIVIAPGCGLAGAEPAYAVRAMRTCRETARLLSDDPEG